MPATFAALHFLFAFTLVACLAAELALLRGPGGAASIRQPGEGRRPLWPERGAAGGGRAVPGPAPGQGLGVLLPLRAFHHQAVAVRRNRAAVGLSDGPVHPRPPRRARDG